MSRGGLPARFPPHGAWPGIMRADVAAAFFDCANTGELRRAITRGEAPPPSDLRGTGRSKEPVWTLEQCRAFITRRFGSGERQAAREDVSDLI
ncbi:hypothetical protein GGR34_003742 [Microvirga flocculans]|uniref:Uncharacterized protein n=1 Tax=Microvirga flocculans TaxID=217168 RepID=A0A7W6IIG0_9HYPH|nr:hypothetical protein [Microvirga flocculans]MBB4042057.1 hypothetical protein [Microvirga flocculans]